MTDIDKLWAALRTAIQKGASEKQINGIANRLDRARGTRGVR